MIEQCREVFLFKNCLIRVKLRKQPDICCPAFRLSRFPAKSVSGASLCGKPDVRLSKRPGEIPMQEIFYTSKRKCAAVLFFIIISKILEQVPDQDLNYLKLNSLTRDSCMKIIVLNFPINQTYFFKLILFICFRRQLQ